MTYRELFESMKTFSDTQMRNKVMVLGGNEEEFSSNTILDYVEKDHPYIIVID